jgi:hypothetical protein
LSMPTGVTDRRGRITPYLPTGSAADDKAAESAGKALPRVRRSPQERLV